MSRSALVADLIHRLLCFEFWPGLTFSPLTLSLALLPARLIFSLPQRLSWMVILKADRPFALQRHQQPLQSHKTCLHLWLMSSIEPLLTHLWTLRPQGLSAYSRQLLRNRPSWEEAARLLPVIVSLSPHSASCSWPLVVSRAFSHLGRGFRPGSGHLSRSFYFSFSAACCVSPSAPHS